MSLTLRSLLQNPIYVRPRARYLEEFYPFRRAMQPSSDLWEVVQAVNRLQDLVDDFDVPSSAERHDAGELTMKREQDGSLQLTMDVTGFKPEDLKIELVDDSLVVHGKSETSGENSFSKSEIKRWFKLPENCKVEDIKSNMTVDNKLLISLPSTKPANEQKKREIAITVDKRPQVEDAKAPNQARQKSDTPNQQSK